MQFSQINIACILWILVTSELHYQIKRTKPCRNLLGRCINRSEASGFLVLICFRAITLSKNGILPSSSHMLFSSCCRFYNKSSNYSLNEFLKQTIHKKLSTVLHLTLLKFFARGVVANIRRNIRIMKNDRSRTQIQIRPRHTVTRYGLTPCFDVFVNVLDSSHLSSSWLWLICSSITTDVAKF